MCRWFCVTKNTDKAKTSCDTTEYPYDYEADIGWAKEHRFSTERNEDCHIFKVTGCEKGYAQSSPTFDINKACEKIKTTESCKSDELRNNQGNCERTDVICVHTCNYGAETWLKTGNLLTCVNWANTERTVDVNDWSITKIKCSKSK